MPTYLLGAICMTPLHFQLGLWPTSLADLPTSFSNLAIKVRHCRLHLPTSIFTLFNRLYGFSLHVGMLALGTIENCLRP
jgi:hypothetical protein